MDSPPPRIPVRLHVLGPDTRILSDLCERCPEGPLGCCAGPPEHDWSDVGRVVQSGGRDFLLAQIAAGNLTTGRRGLTIKRVRRRDDPRMPRERKCVFHGRTGCTIDHLLRPATCNYYCCESVYRAATGDPSERPARDTHARLRATFEELDARLTAEVEEAYPDGPPWDAAFLDWLGARFAEVKGLFG